MGSIGNNTSNMISKADASLKFCPVVLTNKRVMCTKYPSIIIELRVVKPTPADVILKYLHIRSLS